MRTPTPLTTAAHIPVLSNHNSHIASAMALVPQAGPADAAAAQRTRGLA